MIRADPDSVGPRPRSKLSASSTKAALKLAMGTVEKCKQCTRLDYTGTNAYQTHATCIVCGNVMITPKEQ